MLAGLVLLLAAGGAVLLRSSPGAGPPNPMAAVGRWHSLPDLSGIRGATSAVVLKDGRALVVGGGVGSIPLAAAEIFDPATSGWSRAADLHNARRGHSAVVLNDGRVLVAGGVAEGRALASTEIYDPGTNVWMDVGPMATARYAFTLTVLPEGRVLAAGGVSSGAGRGGGAPQASAELFDPSTASWLAIPHGMVEARSQSAAASLKDGRVLVTGGIGAAGTALASTELFDPAVAAFVRSGDMGWPRQGHTATRLDDGRVVAAGGSSADAASATAELYDPTEGNWHATGNMIQGRSLHAASRLANGLILVSGGESARGGSRTALRSAEIFDVSNGVWKRASDMSCPRGGQAQVALARGVLVAGGDAAFPGKLPRAQSCVELFEP